MEENLNVEEAYKAMFLFLEELYSSMGQDVQLGEILGSMSLIGDKMPVDAALWKIWNDSIKKLKDSDPDISLKFIQ
jgi:hypothetical protein